MKLKHEQQTRISHLSTSALLSIITVSRNDPVGLARTIDSLKPLSQSQIELIVVDGSDEAWYLVDLKERLSIFRNNKLLRENDTGIYDAMNKGLKLSQGHYIWFLNGGDTNLLTDVDFISNYVKKFSCPVIMGNYRMRSESFTFSRKAGSLKKMNHGLPTSHQAIFYPQVPFKEQGFDLNFKICGDYASVAKLLMLGVPFIKIDLQVAEFQLDGISGIDSKLLRLEAKNIQKEIMNLSIQKIFLSQLRHRVSALIRKLAKYIGRKFHLNSIQNLQDI